jgi:tRNA pseudouridine38-40 synthase
MRNIKLLLSYDGSAYRGWERQKEGRTLQQTLEEAIQSLTGESVRVVASGRTDAGVHALGHVANFMTDSRHDCDTIRRALNAILPDDFRVMEATEVDLEFHARYTAKGKLYRYVMCDGPVVDPLLRRYVVQCDRSVDDLAMRQAAEYLRGTHDFSSFETAGAPRGTSVRTVSHIAVFRGGPECIWSRIAVAPNRESDLRSQASEPTDSPLTINDPSYVSKSLLFLEIAADGFLYNMVRSIAGTLLNVGRGYWSADVVQEILQAKDRTRAGPTAPSHGLVLVQVYY